MGQIKSTSMKKPKVILKIQSEESIKNDTDLRGIDFWLFILEDFLKVSYFVTMIYIDVVLVAYPFTFLKEYSSSGTIFSIFFEYRSTSSLLVIPIILIIEIFLIFYENKIYSKIWSHKKKAG